MQISAKIVAHSKNEYGNEIATLVCTFPRFILAELNTHRVLSKNSASSRAIPFPKMVKMVQEDPFIPIAWQKDHKGMQGTEYLDKQYSFECDQRWLLARNNAIKEADYLSGYGATKQLINRLLEPFMWHTVILTGTEWENFFHLRCPKYDIGDGNTYKSRKDAIKSMQDRGIDTEIGEMFTSELEWLQANKGQAEIHMMALAESIYDALKESTPKELKAGEWHIPFGDNLNENKIADTFYGTMKREEYEDFNSTVEYNKIQIATARCARVSYLNFEGKDDYEADIDLCKSLLQRPYTNKKGIVFGYDDPIHASPSEHCARAMGDEDLDKFFKVSGGVVEPGWCKNFKGFIQYRQLIEE